MKILKPILITLGITFFLLVFTVFSMGGGHGTFMIAKLVYPYSMSMILLENKMSALSIIIAVIQIPIYGTIFYQKGKWKHIIWAIHFLALIVCFYINGFVDSYYN